VAVLSADTHLSQVLGAIPGALDYIVSLNPRDLDRLRNPVLRRYMSPRISLRRVAAMVGLLEVQLVEDLQNLAAAADAETFSGRAAITRSHPSALP